MDRLYQRKGKIILLYMLFWSFMLIAATPLAAVYAGETTTFWSDFVRILCSPSKVLTDNYNLGGFAATLFNSGLCGLGCCLATFLTGSKTTSKILAGYFLVIAHCFYGLNFLNMWPPFFGVLLYCYVCKKDYSENLHVAMFATSLGPFISEFLFRYAHPGEFVVGVYKVTITGIILAILFSITIGFLFPALLPSFKKFHRGYTLYNAGLAGGIFGILLCAFFYKTMNQVEVGPVDYYNANYAANGYSYNTFVFVFFIIIFVITLLLGYFANGRSFKGYRKLLNDTGYEVSFIDKYGVALTAINIGVYGLCILLYMALIFIFTKGSMFTGPSTGVVIAALTFSTSGQHIKNVFPVVMGFVSLYIFIYIFCNILQVDVFWTLSTQGYINGVAFATGLCPFAGKYGWKVGMVAGFMEAILCTATAPIHGGFVLYNSGFSVGLVAIILLPILDFYNIKEKY